MDVFDKEYKRLNKAQKEAVDTIDGPVMVVAGPGTGKTQVLALRIANILKKTDTSADSILCLTFTRSGVRAMQERLFSYISEGSRNVVVQTFHSFAISLVEKFFDFLDFDKVPTLLKDDEIVFLIDEILHSSDWQHLHSRVDVSKYFSDLKSLVSLLKRERITSTDLLFQIEQDIKFLETDESSISTRGEFKGKLKKEIQKKIESLTRTKEIALFFEKYESFKKERGFMDYDDALEYAVRLVEENDSVRSEIRENFLYVHVDEHQDSSGVQNSFLKAVWQDTDKPNIFVVGDDRQLIYGFGGANISYFEEFKTAFGKAHLITLVENYRSTKPILSLADSILESSITKEKLRSNRNETNKVLLSEYFYARDEIIGAGLHFKKIIEEGVDPSDCALLVPKNRFIYSAVMILKDMGLPVHSTIGVPFFASKETIFLRNILGIVANPFDNILLAESILDPISNIPPLLAHSFLYKNNKELSVEKLLEYGKNGNLFDNISPISNWGKKIKEFLEYSHKHSVLETVHKIGNEILIDTAEDYESLIEKIEVVRTFIHLVTERLEKNKNETLSQFLDYLNRLEKYNHNLSLATLSLNKGINVMTLHSSKGLEYESVWVAHVNESTLMSSKRMGFVLPEKIDEIIEKKDKEVIKRELYVAITRAKKFCTISYSTNSYNNTELKLAEILQDVPSEYFEKKSNEENQNEILNIDPKIYVQKEIVSKSDDLKKLKENVREIFADKRVSTTLLNNFFECPWKWYFRNLILLPDLKSEVLQFGSVVHSTIEIILKTRKKPTDKFIKDILENEFKKEKVFDKSAIVRLVREGFIAVSNWIEKYYFEIAKDYETERSISVKDPNFPEFLFYGKIDLTERFDDGTIMVTDFKTGSPKTKGVIEKKDEEGRMSNLLRQLAMYSFLISRKENKKVDITRLLFLEANKDDKNAVYNSRIDKEEIDLLLRDFDDYNKFVKSGDWINRPCRYKSYGNKDMKCKNCELARRVFKISK